MTSVPGGGDVFCVSHGLSYLHLSSNPPSWTRVCVLVRAVKDGSHTAALCTKRTQHAPHCPSSPWALLPWGSCVVLSARGHLGCQRGASYGSDADETLQTSSPLPATLNRLRHEGALKRLAGWRAAVHPGLLSATVSVSTSQGCFSLGQPLLPKAAASTLPLFHFPFWRTSCIAHSPARDMAQVSGIPSSKSGSQPPGASSEPTDTSSSTSWLPAPPPPRYLVPALPGPPSKLLSVFIIPIPSLVSSCPRGGMWLLPAVATSVIP